MYINRYQQEIKQDRTSQTQTVQVQLDNIVTGKRMGRESKLGKSRQ